MSLFKKKLPKEGSYIEKTIKYQFNSFTWKGIVGHHGDKKRYYIETGTSVLCSIKP